MKNNLLFIILISIACAVALADIGFIIYFVLSAIVNPPLTIPSLFSFALALTITNGLTALTLASYWFFTWRASR